MTGTADTPMRWLEAYARIAEKANPDILAVNVHAGFSFADTHDTGLSFTVCTVGDRAAAVVRQVDSGHPGGLPRGRASPVGAGTGPDRRSGT